MQKKRNIGFIYFLAFTFLALSVFGGLGFYNNVITGSAPFEIDPFKDITSGFREFIKEKEVVGYILVFIALYAIIYIIISQIYIFKGAQNKWPAILSSVSMTLIPMIFIPEFTGTVIGLFSYSITLATLILIILVVWVVYSMLHKQVSEAVGEFADIATTRDQRRAEAMSAKGERISAKRGVISGKSELRDEKAKLAWKAKLLDRRNDIDKQIKILNATAIAKGKIQILK